MVVIFLLLNVVCLIGWFVTFGDGGGDGGALLGLCVVFERVMLWIYCFIDRTHGYWS
jgi:hypothetical protein